MEQGCEIILIKEVVSFCRALLYKVVYKEYMLYLLEIIYNIFI